MRMLLLLAIVSLPASAEELQFDLSGTTGGFGVVPTPFDLTFDLNTLTGTNSFAFTNGCLSAWQFSGVHVSNLFATVGGKSVLYVPSTVASGNGGELFPDCTFEQGSIQMPQFQWSEILGLRTAPLNPQDPLADILKGICHLPGRPGDPSAVIGCNFAEILGTTLDVDHLTVTRVPEPGTLGLMLLGLVATALRTTGRLYAGRRH